MAEGRSVNVMSVELAIRRELAYRKKVASLQLDSHVEFINDLLPLQVTSSNPCQIPNASPQPWSGPHSITSASPSLVPSASQHMSSSIPTPISLPAQCWIPSPESRLGQGPSSSLSLVPNPSYQVPSSIPSPRPLPSPSPPRRPGLTSRPSHLDLKRKAATSSLKCLPPQRPRPSFGDKNLDQVPSSSPCQSPNPSPRPWPGPCSITSQNPSLLPSSTQQMPSSSPSPMSLSAQCRMPSPEPRLGEGPSPSLVPNPSHQVSSCSIPRPRPFPAPSRFPSSSRMPNLTPRPSHSGIKRKTTTSSLQRLPPQQQPSYGNYIIIDHVGNFFCKICRVPCFGPLNLKQHIKGHKHKAKLQQLRLLGNDVGEQVDPQQQRCELCQIWCPNEELLKMHLKGKKHVANLRELEIGQKSGKKATQRPRCELCQIWCMNERALEQHLKGQKHYTCLHAIQGLMRANGEVASISKLDWEKL